MKTKTYLYILVGLGFFFSLVYFNYFKAQEAIKKTRPSPLLIELVSYPELLGVGSKGTFLWHIESSPDLFTTFTTIYWSYQSSPSALTRMDSPQAVGYPYYLPDFSSGKYSLPNDFELRYLFDQSSRVFFRAYAKISNEHLWSEEKSLEVIK
ncbi:hypothetical protein COT86_03905 [Candidatus Collierbacteria bacterium CG10_big_fil_rev_8_21_14_0_10_43_36]|uniref:Uncharacterized protein n=3 Tax=Candidatus Collieribacteriota TaxID=1752725 RepID=A0A2H0DUY6_9BACT|nr:hypothetical protein [bacterium]PIP85390.1 MAG: hypothetical protein COW83_04515 [Candidatus Collierbacteria bacterium CG22_combo_CG10-13_8_21_14_all_43_12]PIR99472.1 MAG: hypothetical protein COT86_03905 [Candidatus Collierbacteria bacterium CG10_big_fil_rev_8_21_14_0_10_43_36]PIZ24943.1 MAG: hypothetical protein COY48_00245 [Candidatus Collierbacteria bacterium CG_4_10_14_0_8_um_filter_43_86]PJB48321.1 MAG: hypothetical protein CO104_01535 [Candidatus Collierbacteria bacterium CG_4_9_14_3_